MNFMLHVSLFGVLTTLLVAVYIYRHWLENHDDHYIHLHGDSHDDNIISSQAVMGKRLEMIDKVKNGLLAATVAYALAIIGMAIYWAWNNNNG